MKAIILLTFSVMMFSATLPPLFAGTNDTVRGHKKPRICITGGNRCVLKQLDQVLYWCLKDAKQLTLDVRRTTSPIKKTYREKLGHCSKILPILEE